MKILVCGAGSVGRSIVGYISKGNNDIIVIDNDQRRLDDMAKEFDILPVYGSASHPDVLEQAGAKKVDLLIAATDVDEVNLVACQVAHTLFNVPKKIARVDNQDFLEPIWSRLFNDTSIPVDLVISPEVEIAQDIFNILKIPGTSENFSLLDNRLHMIAFKCPADCPLIQIPITRFERVEPDLKISIISIVRKGKNFIPCKNDHLEAGDEVYLLVETDALSATIHAFGMERPANEKVIIFGGNQIARWLAKKIEADDNFVSCKIIEEDAALAGNLARNLSETVIIQGQMMSDLILSEAGIRNTDVTVAVTIRDKDNLLASLLAQKSGVPSTISLINSPSYNNLIENIGDSILIDRSAVTISSILKELRHTQIINAYSLGRGFGELWEISVAEEDAIADRQIKDLNLPAASQICALAFNEEILIYPCETEVLKPGSKLILFVESPAIRKIEQIFSS